MNVEFKPISESPPPEAEDDVAELVDAITVANLQGDSVHVIKDQLRTALVLLIDKRIVAMLGGRAEKR